MLSASLEKTSYLCHSSYINTISSTSDHSKMRLLAVGQNPCGQIGDNLPSPAYASWRWSGVLGV